MPGGKLSIIIPCYNEESGISRTLKDMPSFVSEVIVVDNNSNDKSAQTAEALGAKLVKEYSRGYGRAITAGLNNCQTDIIGLIDADGTYKADYFKEALELLGAGKFDFISFNRFPLAYPRAMPLLNKCANYFVSWLATKFFGVRISDLQSGMMIFTRKALTKLKLRNKGMGFSQEIKIKAWLDPSVRCKEIHVPYYPRIGKIKFRRFRDGLKNLFDLALLRLNPGLKSGI